MAATYPAGIYAYTARQDYTDFNYAADINAAYSEIVAVEAALGTQVALWPRGGDKTNPVTVSDILDHYWAAIAALQSKTQNPWSTQLAGPTSGLYISAASSAPSGLLLQAHNGTGTGNLYLQDSGGDLLLAGGGGTTTVFGPLNVAAGSRLTTDYLTVQVSAAVAGPLSVVSLTATGNVSANSLSGVNGTISGTLTSRNVTLSGGVLLLAGNERFYSQGTNQSMWDGDQVASIKKIHGHIYAYASPAWASGGWQQANIIAIRGDIGADGNPTDYNVAPVYATYSNYGGGVAFTLLTNAQATNLGWSSLNGASTANAAFYGSAFVVASSGSMKDDIRDMEPPGLHTLKKLRPVTFRRKQADFFAPATVDKEGRLVPAKGAEREQARQRHEAAISVGDRKRAELDSHGLIAEELDKVFPEAIHYNADGSPAGIDYSSVIALLVKANQELHQKVIELESLVREHLV